MSISEVPHINTQIYYLKIAKLLEKMRLVEAQTPRSGKMNQSPLDTPTKRATSRGLLLWCLWLKKKERKYTQVPWNST